MVRFCTGVGLWLVEGGAVSDEQKGPKRRNHASQCFQMKMSYKIIVALLILLIKVFEGGTEDSRPTVSLSDEPLSTTPSSARKVSFNDTELWTKFTLVVRPDSNPRPGLGTTEKNGVIYTTNRSLLVPTPTSPFASKWTKVSVTLPPPRRPTPPTIVSATTLLTFATQKPTTTLSTVAVTNRSVLLPPPHPPVAETRRKPEKKDRQDDIFYDDEDEDYEDEDEDEEDEEEEEGEEDVVEDVQDEEVVEVEKFDYENYSEEPPPRLKKKKKRKKKRGKKHGGVKLKDFKKLKKFMLPLLLAYKLKFFTLVPLLLGGLVLIVGTTGFAGFFFALFAVGLGLKHH